MAWGPHRIQIYNDGYRPICGDKHPGSLGQDFKECWLSAWDAVGGPFERASAGKPDFLVNERMFLDRNGYLEETFFTFSFSPIRDESGGVGGLFHPVTEMTQHTLAERRLKVLRDLADSAAEAKTVATACDLLARTLAGHALDVPFALLYLLDAEGRQAGLVARAGLAPDSPLSPPLIILDGSESAWPLSQAVHERQPIRIDDVEQKFGSLSCGPYPEPPKTAFVLPIALSGIGHPFGLLVAGVSSRRALDDVYHTFYLMLAGAVTNVLTNARAYEEERKKAEALAELDKAKTVFFSNVSHEFRTALTLMLGPIENAVSSPERALRGPDLETVHRNSLRLLKLVNTLLDFSRIEAGRIEASYEPTDISRLTSELASVFRSAMEKAGMELIVDCPPISEPVYLDREMWEKIVLNLLSNAFKFTFEGSIEVKLRSAKGRAVLSVRDTGTGIPEEELQRIFERFHRVKGAQARTFEGTGISLALVKELVRLHGGDVSVKSEKGKGSIFAVSIPLGRSHLPTEKIGAARALASTSVGASSYLEEALQWLPGAADSVQGGTRPEIGQPLQVLPGTESGGSRILVADDNADMLDYLHRLLAGQYVVCTAANGEEALAAALQDVPDLVLADVMMPKLDGFGLLRALRENEKTRSVPVILLSARAGEESKVEGLEAGAGDYLVKPFSSRELLARVAAHLQMDAIRRREEKALREREERFRAFVATASEVVYRMSPDWREMRELHGGDFIADTEEPSRTWLEKYIHPDDQPHVTKVINEAIRTKSVFELEHRVRRVDGTLGWTFSRAIPVLDDKGEILEWFGAAADITARKETQEELRRSEEQRTFLLKLADTLASIEDPAELLRTASTMLGEHIGDRVRWGEICDDDGLVVVRPDYFYEGPTARPGDI